MTLRATLSSVNLITADTTAPLIKFRWGVAVTKNIARVVKVLLTELNYFTKLKTVLQLGAPLIFNTYTYAITLSQSRRGIKSNQPSGAIGLY